MAKYELVVMGFLNDRAMHGYQINREVKTHRMDSWAKISPPMVYKTLANLEKEKMVNKVKVEREGLMPERRIYELTKKGREFLGSLVEKSLMERNLTFDLSNLGYFFILSLPKDKALECLEKKKTLLERTIKSLNKRLEDFRGKTPLNRFVVIEKDLDRFKGELQHLKKLIKKAENSKRWTATAFV